MHWEVFESVSPMDQHRLIRYARFDDLHFSNARDRKTETMDPFGHLSGSP